MVEDVTTTTHEVEAANSTTIKGNATTIATQEIGKAEVSKIIMAIVISIIIKILRSKIRAGRVVSLGTINGFARL